MSKKNLFLGSLIPILTLSVGCSNFEGAQVELNSLQSQLPNINGKAGSHELELTAVSEVIAELQISQVDGLMASTVAKLGMSGSGSGWGDVSSNLNTAASSGSGGGWGGAATNNRIPDNNITATRDCALGGNFVAKTKPTLKVATTDTKSIFSEDTTPELDTEITNASVQFNDCRVADSNFNEYVISGTLTATNAQATSAFTVSGSDLAFIGRGISSISGSISIVGASGKTDCSVNLSSDVTQSHGDVTVEHKSGIVRVQSGIVGSLCDSEVSLEIQRSIGF
ncbi:MAG: hypothetical protein KDD61_08275 [Bdellovibrionales bacterium]|nr:hypothetical protein [Bdellovibrionales bacterium]